MAGGIIKINRHFLFAVIIRIIVCAIKTKDHLNKFYCAANDYVHKKNITHDVEPPAALKWNFYYNNYDYNNDNISHDADGVAHW